MSTQVKHRRGTAAENAAFTGADGEIVTTTDTNRLVLHDSVVAGGYTIPNAADLLSGAITRGTATGTDTYALTLPYFPSYTSGYEIDVTFTNANTTSSTLNVNGLGAKGLKDETGTNFTAGQIPAGGRYIFRYNGTEFRRVSNATAVRTVKIQIFTASGTYTPSAGMLYCEVEAQGAGGGGRGSSNGGNGGNTTFGALLTANGGTGGQSAAGGVGGTASGGNVNINGQNGHKGGSFVTGTVSGSLSTTVHLPAKGADSKLGLGGNPGTAAQNATGYGAGGSTRFSGVGAPDIDEISGASGGYCYKLFDAATIGASQTVTIGAAGSAGGSAGAGTAGIVIVKEYCSQ